MYRVVQRYNRSRSSQCRYTKSYTTSFKQFTTVSSQRDALDRIAKEMHFTQMSDWYNLSSKVDLISQKTHYQDFESKLGPKFQLQYNSSPYQLLSSIYPEYDWLPWKFPNTITTNTDNHKKFIEYAARELKIKEMNDWYHVSFHV